VCFRAFFRERARARTSIVRTRSFQNSGAEIGFMIEIGQRARARARSRNMPARRLLLPGGEDATTDQ